jgi:hypothetical protein
VVFLLQSTLQSVLHDVRSFLGLCGYDQRYVKIFAKIAAPLHELTAGNVTKCQSVPWLPLHEAAFVQLKQALVLAPVLLTPDQLKPYQIDGCFGLCHQSGAFAAVK